MRRMRDKAGFTLIELVVVIILLGVVGIMTTQFMGSGVQLYRDTQEQQSALDTTRFALERLSREVAGAHPASLRLPRGDGSCIEFIPVVGAGGYLGLARDHASLELIDSGADYWQPQKSALAPGRRLSINSQLASELYGDLPAASGSVAALASFTPSAATATVTGAATVTPGSFVWAADSRARRYYVLNESGPVAWCLQGGQLYRYSLYAGSGAWSWDWSAGFPPSGSLMAERLSAGSRFSLVPASLNHNVQLDLSLRVLVEGGEQVLNRRMQVNYVP